MDEEAFEEILYPLFLEYQALDGDEAKDFIERMIEVVTTGVDRWSPSVVESEE